MNLKISSVLVALVLAMGTVRGYSQQRPLLTEDPRVLADGVVAIEEGVSYLHRAKFPVSGYVGEEFQAFVTGLHAGMGRAEFQIEGPLVNFLRIRENGSGNRNDWGDFSLATKIRIFTEAGKRPAVTFRTRVVLPNSNATKGIGPDATDVYGALLFGKTAGPVYLFANTGIGILSDATLAPHQEDVFTFGMAASVRMNARLSMVGEWSGVVNPQSNPRPVGVDRGQVRLGMQVRAAGMRWDLAATAGTTRWDHQAGLVAGVGKEFRAWR